MSYVPDKNQQFRFEYLFRCFENVETIIDLMQQAWWRDDAISLSYQAHYVISHSSLAVNKNIGKKAS